MFINKLVCVYMLYYYIGYILLNINYTKKFSELNFVLKLIQNEFTEKLGDIKKYTKFCCSLYS